MKKTLLIVGCGDIALRTAPLLLKRYRVLGLHRNLNSLDHLRSLGVIPIYGDLDYPESLKRLAGIAQFIVHLAPPPNLGLQDDRTKHLLSALSRPAKNYRAILPQRLIYISTSGVYGNCNGAYIDETCPVHPQTDRAIRRINAEKQIRNWGKRNNVSVSILRVPGIYAENRLPLVRLQERRPVLLASDDGYTNHIHADDLAQIICAALLHGRTCRIYHSNDDSHLKMGDYFDLVATHFDLPLPPRISFQEARERIPPSMFSFMKESRRLKNARIKKELHIHLLYPTVSEGIQAAKLQINKT